MPSALDLDEDKRMMGVTNLEVFVSFFSITGKINNFILFFPGYHDAITTINRKELLIATKSDNETEIKFRNEIQTFQEKFWSNYQN